LTNSRSLYSIKATAYIWIVEFKVERYIVSIF